MTPGPTSKKAWIEKLKTIFFNAIFVFLSLIPLICAALDVTYMVVGIIGEAGFLSLMVILNNGRNKWDWEHYHLQNGSMSASKLFWQLSFEIDPKLKKKIIKMVIISVLANLFMYRTCLCFYNI